MTIEVCNSVREFYECTAETLIEAQEQDIDPMILPARDPKARTLGLSIFDPDSGEGLLNPEIRLTTLKDSFFRDLSATDTKPLKDELKDFCVRFDEREYQAAMVLQDIVEDTPHPEEAVDKMEERYIEAASTLNEAVEECRNHENSCFTSCDDPPFIEVKGSDVNITAAAITNLGALAIRLEYMGLVKEFRKPLDELSLHPAFED